MRLEETVELRKESRRVDRKHRSRAVAGNKKGEKEGEKKK